MPSADIVGPNWRNGDGSLQHDLVPSEDNTLNLGSATKRFKTIHYTELDPAIVVPVVPPEIVLNIQGPVQDNAVCVFDSTSGLHIRSSGKDASALVSTLGGTDGNLAQFGGAGTDVEESEIAARSVVRAKMLLFSANYGPTQTLTEGTILPQSNWGSYVFPANSMAAGSVAEFDISYLMAFTIASVMTIRVKVNGTTIATLPVGPGLNEPNFYGKLRVRLQMLDGDAVVADCQFTGAQSPTFAMLVGSTWDRTISTTVDITGEWNDTTSNCLVYAGSLTTVYGV